MKRLLILVAIAALLVACGGHSQSAAEPTSPPGNEAPVVTPIPTTAASSRAPGCDKPAPQAGSSLRTISSDGLERTFRVYVPKSYKHAQTAVVLNYHGFAGESQGQEWYAGYPDAAERFGFIAVTPDGSGDPQRWYLAPGDRPPGYADDFAFTRRMLDDLASVFCVDAARVYASGISNGGFFSSVAACDLQDRIAAIATVAGEGFPDERCQGKKAVPVLVFHGTADATVPFEPAPGRTRLGITIRSTRESVAAWARHNGCSASAKEQRIAADIVFVSYDGCRDNAGVQLYVVEGGGHSWPGAPAVEILGHTTQSVNATELMWRFFAEHPKK